MVPHFRKFDQSKFLLKGAKTSKKVKWNMILPFRGSVLVTH